MLGWLALSSANGRKLALICNYSRARLGAAAMFCLSAGLSLPLTAADSIETGDIRTSDGTAGFAINGSPDNWAGRAVASAGDINGDGLADLVVGTPLADVGGVFNTGQAYVIYGQSDASPFAELNLTSLEPGNGGDGSRGFVIRGFAGGETAGSAVGTLGDINGDGYDDLGIGAFRAAPGAIPSQGAAYVIFGRGPGEDAFGAEFQLSDLTGEATNNGQGIYMLGGVEGFLQFGAFFDGLGDFNGDGLNDFAIGSLPVLAGRFAPAGRTYVFYGRAADDPWPATYPITNNFDTRFGGDGSRGFYINGMATGDASGQNVSGLGDINDDGFADLMLTAPEVDSSQDDTGEAYIIYGRDTSQNPFDPVVELGSLRPPFGQDPDRDLGFIVTGADENEALGSAGSSAGDVNGDGISDIILGAVGSEAGGSFSGRAYVIFGRPRTMPFPVEFPISRLFAGNGGDGSEGFAATGGADDRAGKSVGRLGDLNGDGVNEIVIGADGHGSVADLGGAGFVVYGRAANNFPAEVNLRSISQNNNAGGFAVLGSAASGFLGQAVAGLGDINGDGSTDYILGAPQEGGGNTGSAYVLFGEGNDAGSDTNPLAFDGSLTGSWYDPARSGEGLVLEFGNIRGQPGIFVSWYAHLGGEQLWLTSNFDNYSPGDDQLTSDLIVTEGAQFGDAFDPNDVSRSVWGSVQLTRTECGKLQLSYQRNNPSLSGSQELVPLLADALGLPACSSAKAGVAKQFVGLDPNLAGTWWNPNRSGEGFVIDIETRGDRPTVFVSWFTYRNGQQMWLVGSKDLTPGDTSIADIPLTLANGTGFGPGFDPDEVVRTPWGSLSITYSDCSNATVSYTSTVGDGSGTIELQRLGEGLTDRACSN